MRPVCVCGTEVPRTTTHLPSRSLLGSILHENALTCLQNICPRRIPLAEGISVGKGNFPCGWLWKVVPESSDI